MQEKKNPGLELAERPPFLAELLDRVNHPDDLDAATARLGVLPLLINPHLASGIDLSDLGLGHAVHLPVQISRACGGRKSLHFLYPGEKALVGLYVTGEGVAFRYLTRETGRSLPAGPATSTARSSGVSVATSSASAGGAWRCSTPKRARDRSSSRARKKWSSDRGAGVSSRKPSSRRTSEPPFRYGPAGRSSNRSSFCRAVPSTICAMAAPPCPRTIPRAPEVLWWKV
jgi:hypothetical protein